ncbi:MAG: hypothetical protein ACOYD1_12785 [Candidatus Nanopelagicales bacterium]
MRRSVDDALLVIGQRGDGAADVALLLDFVTDGNLAPTADGFVRRVFNAVAGTIYPDITAPSNAAQPKVVVAGAPVVGDSGFLAAQFDGTPDGGTPGVNILERSDLLGMVGNTAVTLCGDLHATVNANGFQALGYIGESGVSGTTSGTFNANGYFASGSLGPGSNYLSSDYGSGTFNFATLPDATVFASWVQIARAAGAAESAATRRVAGVNLGSDGTGNGAAQLVFAATPAARFAWGAGPFSGPIFPINGIASNWFCWDVVLGAGDQAQVDAYQASVHA